MKTLVCDLKGTLVTSDGALRVPSTFLENPAKDTQVILYTMNEQWTYETLGRYPDMFQLFDGILLCKSKTTKDFERFIADDVLVVGDSATEELAFARSYGYRSIDATNAFPLEDVAMFLEQSS